MSPRTRPISQSPRPAAGLSQQELPDRAATTRPLIARLEDAEYTGHSPNMLEGIAAACGATLTLHAQRKAHFSRKVALV